MAPNRKKSKKTTEPEAEAEPEPEVEEDEEEVVAEEEEQGNEGEDGAGEQEGDEGEEGEGEDGQGEDGQGGGGGRVLTEEELAERKANAKKRRRAVARRKGYRFLATKGGYSTTVASADASRDVAQNVLSVKEATRACKWAPALPDKAAYATFEEYAERLKLQSEPLPQGPAAVFRASGEVFLRKLVNESMQRTFDAGKTRVSSNTVMSVLRPLQPVLKLSFAAPTGLVRHAQMTTIGAEGKEKVALGSLEMDDAQINKEVKVILPKQIELYKAVSKAAAEAKKAKDGKSKAPSSSKGPALIAKKSKKKTAAA